jgi:hypothetical protein
MARNVPSGMSLRMIGDGREAPGGAIDPDLVRPGGLAMKFKAEILHPTDDLPAAEAGQLPHQVATMSG